MIRHRAFPLAGLLAALAPAYGLRNPAEGDACVVLPPRAGVTLRWPDDLSPGHHRTITAPFGGGLRDASNVPLTIRGTARRTSSQRQDIR